ncbi:MAG: TIGR03067 domain-containing protein [Gemmataceae bacterium]|nr:TIGR03067 domain-containing protein [Gemmataceae bacterium]
MRRIVLLVVAVAGLGFAPAPFLKKPVPAEADLKALQGEWVEARASVSGGAAEKQEIDTRIVVAASRLAFIQDGKETVRWNFALDPRTRPKTMDMGAGSADEPVCYRLIYRLEGDTLILSQRMGGGEGGARPTSFEPGLGLIVAEYHRKKP